MKFAKFIFPEARTADLDAENISDALEEAQLTETLGLDGIWLAEHHFDGNCCYVNPVTFASAVLDSTQTLKVGFAVAQLSLHHPVRLAEQLSLLDNISKGRLIVGIGKGTAYNIYEYHGYSIPHAEAAERYEEAEQTGWVDSTPLWWAAVSRDVQSPCRWRAPGRKSRSSTKGDWGLRPLAETQVTGTNCPLTSFRRSAASVAMWFAPRGQPVTQRNFLGLSCPNFMRFSTPLNGESLRTITEARILCIAPEG
jgi:hypothetical protein